MRIDFVCEGFNERSAVALPWRHVHEIAKSMQAMGNTVRVLTDRSPEDSQHEELDNIPVHRIKKGRLLFDFKDLSKVLDEGGADIVNWFGGPFSTIYFWRFRKQPQTKIVWTVFRGKMTYNDLKGLRLTDFHVLSQYWRNFSYWFIPDQVVGKGARVTQVKRIIAWSGRLGSYVQRLGVNKDKIVIIPPGVDLQKFQPVHLNAKSKERIGFNEGESVILFFGPFSPLRGVDCMESAMPRIVRAFPSARLLILAREQPNCAGLVSSKTSNAVRHVTGIQSRGMIAHYLASADVVALPFRFWPFIDSPLTVLEAMAMGKPVVTTTIGNIPEIVKDGETGILVPPKKADALADAVVRLLADRELAIRIGKNAREYVSEFFSWDRIAKQTLSVFESSLAN